MWVFSLCLVTITSIASSHITFNVTGHAPPVKVLTKTFFHARISYLYFPPSGGRGPRLIPVGYSATSCQGLLTKLICFYPTHCFVHSTGCTFQKLPTRTLIISTQPIAHRIMACTWSTDPDILAPRAYCAASITSNRIEF